MRCPKCGYERQPKDNAFVPPTECPACGVVYAKYESERLAGRIPKLLRKPSPLDESTLRQARERVEQRLRKKMLGRVKSEEKARTLERARKIFLEELRRRWQEQAAREQAQDQSTNNAGQPGTESMQQGLPAAMAVLAESSDKALRATVRQEALGEGSPDDEELGTGRQEEIEEINEMLSAGSQQNHRDADDHSRMTDHGPEAGPYSNLPADRGEAPRWLPAAGIATLIAGIIGALISWATLEPVQAGTLAGAARGSQGLPLELVVGFCYLAVGILGSALFWIIFLMTRQLNQMRNILATLTGQQVRDS